MASDSIEIPKWTVPDPQKFSFGLLFLILVVAVCVTFLIVLGVTALTKLPGFSPCQTTYDVSECDYDAFTSYCDKPDRKNDDSITCNQRCLNLALLGNCSFAQFCVNEINPDLVIEYASCFNRS
jgi:hypothetical protein